VVSDDKRDPEGFIADVFRSACDGCEFDNTDMFDRLEQFGLLRTEKYDPENPDHEGIEGDLEPGDAVYFLREAES
jgi:hypothetical protein